MLTVIPFSGFYESTHDSMLDDALNQMFSDDSGNPNDSLVYRAFDAIDWQKAQTEYARHYVKAFSEEFELKGLTFESMQSPREYNFTTDRIYCHVPASTVAMMRRKTPRAILASIAKDMFTSRSGFISFYSPDVANWGPMREWDHNQLLALITAYVQHMKNGESFGQWEEAELMEPYRDNGYLDNWLFEGAEFPELNRLCTIAYYLRQRQERKYRIGA